MAAEGHQLRTSYYADNWFEIKNDAQAGGSFASMLVPIGTVVKGVSALSKAARTAKTLGTATDVAKAANAATDVVRAGDAAEDAAKTADALADAGKGGPGVHISDKVDDLVKTGDNLDAVAKPGGNTASSVDDKLARYLLNPDHPVGGSKAKWFKEALGFSKENANDLARQIVFRPESAVQTAITEHGIKFNQVTPINGANGKIIDVRFAWIQNNDGLVRLVSGIPAKK